MFHTRNMLTCQPSSLSTRYRPLLRALHGLAIDSPAAGVVHAGHLGVHGAVPPATPPVSRDTGKLAHARHAPVGVGVALDALGDSSVPCVAAIVGPQGVVLGGPRGSQGVVLGSPPGRQGVVLGSSPGRQGEVQGGPPSDTVLRGFSCEQGGIGEIWFFHKSLESAEIKPRPVSSLWILLWGVSWVGNSLRVLLWGVSWVGGLRITVIIIIIIIQCWI